MAVGFLACDRQPPGFTLMSPQRTGVSFANEIVETPENNIMTYQYMYNGAGVALGDVNNDGLSDVFLVGNSVANQLYLNKGDWKFEEVTAQAGVAGRTGHWKTGVSMVDINGDGLLDIYLCYSGNVAGEGMGAPVQQHRTERSNQLFINEGADAQGIPSFREMAAAYGVDAPGSFSSQAYFLDYDRDGDLDLFLVNHANMFYAPFFNTARLRAKRHPYFGNQLFRNEGTRFQDVSEAAGIHGSGLNYGLSSAISDLNGDGWPDFYVTNDYDEQDFLYLNNQDGTFREVSHEALGHMSKFSMGSDIADVNGDGLADILVADMLPEDNYRQKLLKGADQYDKYYLAVDSGFHHQNMRNMLHLHSGVVLGGVPRFQEVGQMAGISNTDWTWAALIADWDNDGYQDLYFTNGYLHDYTNMDFLKYAQDKLGKVIRVDQANSQDIQELISRMPSTPLANYCYRGSSGGSFEKVSKAWGMDQKAISTGAAYGDLDNDGDLDLVVNNLNSEVFLYRNDLSTSSNYLRVRLLGHGKNRQAIGATVEVIYADRKQVRTLYAARGYQSSVEPMLTFGLGDGSSISKVTVRWPDGSTSQLSDVAVNTTLEIAQPQNAAVPPVVAADSKLFFQDVSDSSGIHFSHKENSFSDFKVQRLVPYQMSRLGGKMAVGDANADGKDDVFFGGAMGSAGALYLSSGDTTWELSAGQPWEDHTDFEDISATFFDADADGDTDLYVVSGGNEFPPQHPFYQDRLYLNDGQGHFLYAPEALANVEYASGSVAVPCDFDKDGDMDLLVGGRITPQLYPMPPRTMLLRNESKKGQAQFREVTKAFAPSLSQIGMVTDATWADINGDQWPDLILVGEWMPVSVWLNEQGKSLRNITKDVGLAESHGWWTRVMAADVDSDGDLDFLLGNAGTNLQLRASATEPMQYFVQDMNRDQDPDPIITYYIQGKSFPVPSYDEMNDQIRSFRKMYPTYDSYAQATAEDLLKQNQGGTSFQFRIHELRSAWLENLGNLQFRLTPLPAPVQASMIQDFLLHDFDTDGQMEVLCAGNFYPYRVEWGRSDGFFGAMLRFSKGEVAVYPTDSKQVYLPGDVRDMALLRSGTAIRLVISRNNERASVYRFH